MILFAAWMSTASAAGLDLLEVGGAWGTPTATDATALWWNPAGLGAGHGTRFTFEIAPTFATVNIARDNPNYVPDSDAFGPPDADYGGLAQYKTSAIVPYIGVASDFGQPGLGLGFGLAVPHGKSAKGSPDQVTHHHLIEGGNQALYLMVAGSYEIKDRVSFGVTGAYVASTYNSNLYSETGTALNEGLKENFDQDETFYSDTMIEDTRYASHVVSEDLHGSAITFGAGIHVKATDKISLAATYRHGLRVDHTGGVALDFDCPSTDDLFGRIGAQVQGICDANLTGQMSVGYNLPARIHGGIVFQPKPEVRLEAMGGYVFWNAFSDYEIDIRIDPDSVDQLDDPAAREETAALVSQTKLWARDQQNSFWVGADGKFDVHEHVMLGGRVLYDKGAVPTQVLSSNNYDANTIALTGLVVGKITPNLHIGLSGTQYIAQKRTVTDSAWGITMYDNKKEGRYFYPALNGTFASSITRIGVSVRGQFDHGKSKPEPAGI
ncbi:MAG: outer membrane protein transport protein [Alphaproteobacteria bacterium]|nr:outer membrane protein transport protein [Alphaproteobacteria bacterium]